MSFERNVFINCPFDDSYKELLWPLLFTIVYIDLEPILSQTVSSGNIRVEEIKKQIKNSRYSIHDISRCKPLATGDTPRFNMPFEMGLDIGCQTYGHGKLKNKKCLILETEKYYYQKVISDIGGQDIKNHNDDAKQIIAKVREWFVVVFNKRLHAADIISDEYSEFVVDTEKTLAKDGYGQKSIYGLSLTEYLLFVKSWIII
jgi:hypothetical protein